jgi:hypothetical protein
MPSIHELTCQRPGCGRSFTARRRDAGFCSRSCRRAKSRPAPPVEVVEAALPAAEEPTEVEEDEDDLQGWRRVGGYLVPPADPRNIFHLDQWPYQ